jgi:hypothetical protein
MAIAAIGFTVADTVIAATSVAAAGTSAYLSARASSQQATAASQIANYNAKVDIAQANQDAMNAQANIEKQRTDNASYDSNQRAALAASGVLSGTGSPMALQATTVGRQEQDIQQYWTQTQEQESSQYQAAELGVYEGAQEADTYHLQGAADIFQGVGQMTNSVGLSMTRAQQMPGGGSTNSSAGNDLF